MGLLLETKSDVFWQNTAEVPRWRVFDEQALPIELLSGATRFKTYATESVLSSEKYLVSRGNLIAEYKHPQCLHEQLSTNIDPKSDIPKYDQNDVLNRLRVLGLHKEHSELLGRKDFIENNGVLIQELSRGDVGFYPLTTCRIKCNIYI